MIPPLALRRCPADRCGLRLRATLQAGAPPLLACDRRHVWRVVADSSPIGWRLERSRVADA